MKKVAFLLFDIVAAIVAYSLALWMKNGFKIDNIPSEQYAGFLRVILIIIALTIIISLIFRVSELFKSWSVKGEAILTFAACLLIMIIAMGVALYLEIQMPILFYISGFLIMYVIIQVEKLIARTFRTVKTAVVKDTAKDSDDLSEKG